jgi:hypothetical protein
LIDLNSDHTSSDRFLKLKHQIDLEDAIGFLPNGDLIHVLVRGRKIYKYCFTDKPKNTVPWEYSQIIDIVIPESLNNQIEFGCYIYLTKLFLMVERKILQFDLLTMNLERKYPKFFSHLDCQITMNKSQTLLATGTFDYAYIYSMENGMLIYNSEYYFYNTYSIFLYGKIFIYSNYNLFAAKENCYQVEFITLKNTERLVNCIANYSKLVDPYQVYDEIDISDDFNKTSVITKLNRKIFINNGKVCVTNGLDENKLQQLSNKTISIYSLSTFKIIQSMLNEIIDQVDIKKVSSREKNKVEIIKNSLWIEYSSDPFLKRDWITREDNGISRCYGIPYILSFKLLNNQDLILIHMRGIDIHTTNEDRGRHRYFWNNNEWNDIFKKFEEERGGIYDNNFIDEHGEERGEIYDNNFIDEHGEERVEIDDNNFINEHYKPLIERILKNEFDDSKHSIPLPNIVDAVDLVAVSIGNRKEIVEDVINNKFVLPKAINEMLEIAIKKKYNDVVRQIIESTQDYSENYMNIISLNLAELCDYCPDYIIKYISRTSIMLSPYCLEIVNSENSSLHSYTDIYIKESNMKNKYFEPISAKFKGLIQHLRIKEVVQTVSFIVPFPQICVYQDDSKNNDHENRETENNNHDIKSKIITILKKMITGLKIIMIIPKSKCIWNEVLYKPKSILFCNIDSNHFYNWWNFAAIIDFKWNTFGKVYYYLIWLFYTIFHVCYVLASTLEQKSIPDFYFKLLFIISIIFGSLLLIFEIRHCIWNYKIYFNDVWNLFGK